MILSSHIIVAAAATAPLVITPISPANTALIFLTALASHYLLDLIPHWDYKLSSITNYPKDKETVIFKKELLWKDLWKVSSDGLLGLVIALWILNLSFSFEQVFLLLIIVLGAILTDILEIIYAATKKSFLASFHKFHHICHTNHRFENQPIKGILFQAAIVATIVVLSLSF